MQGYDAKFADMMLRTMKERGFCTACGARYPDLFGQGKCDKCTPAFELDHWRRMNAYPCGADCQGSCSEETGCYLA